MKESTKAYFAGLVDSEGSLYVEKGHQKNYPNCARYSLALSVANDSRQVMQWIMQNFGGTFRRRIQNDDISYEWTSKSLSHISRVLDLILPYLFIKRSQAILAKEFISLNGEMNPNKREEIFQEMGRLKSVECVTTNMLSGFSLKQLRSYFAGLFDGEGYIRVYRYHRRPPRRFAYQVKLTMTNTEKKILEYGKSHFGGSIYKVKKQKSDEKQRYSWEITNNRMREHLLLNVLPHLIVKREQAKNSLNFLRIPKFSQALSERERLFQISEKLMIESKLDGNTKSESAVTQNFQNTIG